MGVLSKKERMCSDNTFSAFALSFNFLSALCTIITNKYALNAFPYPASLTAIHYLFSWGAVAAALYFGVFERGTVQAEHKNLFYMLVVAWAMCNALSNASLGANSVGFYQLMKVLTTPIVVFVDFIWHNKKISSGKAWVLALACLGIAVATVSDVKLSLRGTLIALSSVMTGVMQKMLNEHMQQRGGLSTLQLMLEAFPTMTLIGFALVPIMDPPGVLSVQMTTSLLTKVHPNGASPHRRPRLAPPPPSPRPRLHVHPLSQSRRPSTLALRSSPTPVVP